MAKFSELINQMIKTILQSSTWTSAGQTRVDNFLNEFRGEESVDLESVIKEIVKDQGGATKSDDVEFTKQKKQIAKSTKQLKAIDKGNLGDMQRFTSSQFGNIKQMATDPAGFIIQTFIKRFAKGVGIIAFALIIFESVKWVISELLKPGRWLDLRFKRDIGKEILAFRKREDQQKLKQGFSNIIITTQPRLRATSGAQITNTLNMVGGRQPFPENIGQSNIMIEASGVSFSKSHGKRSFIGTGR